MIEHIEKQITKNVGINLLFAGLIKVIEIDKDFKRKVLSIKEAGEEISESSIDKIIKIVLDNLYEINQYIDIDEKGIQELKDLYRTTYNGINYYDFDFRIKKHFSDLSEILERYYPENYKHVLRKVERIGRVVNEQYSFDLQNEIFGISAADFLEPIIDVGCGKDAEFVKGIESYRKDVYGIDRLLNYYGKHMIEKSWFDYKFEPDSWGTIYSNMSFSNHIIYVINNDRSQLMKYIRKYFEILDSLKVGGAFYYSPAVPELEDRISSDEFIVSRKEAANDYLVTRIKRIKK